MRAALMAGACALISAAAVYGIDINPDIVRGGNINEDIIPPPDKSLYKLYENSATPAHPEYVYEWNDGYVWYYDNDPYKTYVYKMFRFTKPTGYTTGTLRWKEWAQSGNTVHIYRWDNGSKWESVGTGTGDWIHYITGISGAWFSGEWHLWFLVVVQATQNDPAVWCDVFDLQYEFQ